MDGGPEKRESGDAVIAVENEAESMPVQEEKSVATTLNFLDICPVCHLNFHSREPKLLPCLHSFCKKCLPTPSRNLAMMPDPPTSQVDNATKPLNVIRCPVCRQECMEVDVMENFFVKDSVEAPSSTVERTVQLCMTCDDNTVATGFCVDCVEYLCVTCVEAHQRVKFTKDHTIRQKAEVWQEAHGVSTQRPVFCDIHKQEPLKLFCETCDLLTCRDCQLLKHKDHNYQFLEDAYNNHKHHMESLTNQLQEKKKVIEEVSSSINNGLLQVDQNRTSVHNEIKKSICSLILEINKKGKILVNQLEAVTKDHEGVLKKQHEDIGYLSRHLEHVINFTKWATARSGGTALLYCKRLILFQIGNLLRAKCSTSFVPQSSVRFQCRSAYWASNVDLGSLVVESVPGHQLGGFQGIPHQLIHPGPGPSGSPSGLAPGPRLASHHTLAQLQMQVEKLNPQHWQPQPQPPPWSWYQSVRLQRTAPGPLQGGSPSQSMPAMPPQPGRRFMVPPPSHLSPTSNLPSPGFAPQSIQPLMSNSGYQPKHMDVFSSSPLYSHNAPLPSNGSQGSPHSRQLMEPTYLNKRSDPGGPMQIVRLNYPQSVPSFLPNRSAQGQQNPPGYPTVSQEEKPGTVSWKPSETQQANGAVGSAAKRRRRSSPGPVIVIKDEPEDDISFIQAIQRANLPDSTGDQQPQTRLKPGGEQVHTDSTGDQQPQTRLKSGGDQVHTDSTGDQQPQTRLKSGGEQVLTDSTGDQQPQTKLKAGGEQAHTTPPSTENKLHTPPQTPRNPGDQSQATTPNQSPSLGRGAQQPDKGQAPAEDPNEDWCAVCQNGGELLCCEKCPKVFHLTCHVPSLLKSPSGEWFCSFCRDLSVPELEYDCDSKPGAKTVKEEPGSDGGFPPVDKRKCERLLLRLFCSELSSDFQEPPSPATLAENRQTIKTPMALSIVKTRLEDKQKPCYQSCAEFVSDVRLLFRNCAVLNEADTEVATAGRKLGELFEEHLKILYPDQAFPQVKTEVVSPARPPPVPQPSSPKETCQPVGTMEHQLRNLESQDAQNSPKGEKEAV